MAKPKTARSGAPRRRIVVVLGMHRSGTSAVARGMLVLGAGLGERLKAPIAGDNDKGFWEDAELSAVNDGLIEALDRRWHSLDLSACWTAQDPRLRRLRPIAAKLLQERLDAHALFTFKDPRTSITLPFWQALFAELGIADCYVLAFRNPLSVALSLERRDKFARFKSFHLWLTHTLSAIQHSSGRPRVFVDYDDLMADPRKQLARIARGLGGGLALHEPDALPYASEFLEARLQHNRATAQELAAEPSASPMIRELYEALRRQAGRTAGAAGAAEEAEWRGFFARARELEPLARGVEALSRRNEALDAMLPRLQATASELAQARRARDVERDEARKHIAALGEWAASAEAHGKALLAETEALRAARETESAEARKQIAALTGWARSADAHGKSLLSEMEALRAARETESAEARKQIAALTGWAQSADAHGKGLALEMEALRAARETESAEARRHVAALTEWAASADAHARALLEEVEGLRAARATESAEAGKHIASLTERAIGADAHATALLHEVAGLRSRLGALEAHWLVKLARIANRSE